jgi:hypothetical protein
MPSTIGKKNSIGAIKASDFPNYRAPPVKPGRA